MSRMARKKSCTGLYHVMLRGADRRTLFSDDEDNQRFLEILQRVKRESMFQLFAYCLMGNHVHLLLQEGKEPLGMTFKRIGFSYVHYYNWKYQLYGHLFQDRYRSEQVEDDAYFLDVLRYICQNPVKAGLCEKPFEYPWLGCSGITEDDAFLDSFELFRINAKSWGATKILQRNTVHKSFTALKALFQVLPVDSNHQQGRNP